MNAYHDVVKFTLPELVGGSRWLCLLDTNQPERSDTPTFDVGDVYGVTARSFLLLAGLTAGGPGRAVQRIALELAAPAPRATRRVRLREVRAEVDAAALGARRGRRRR